MLTAAVLAAGASTRMGKNKLALPWQDSTVLESTMHLVEESGFDRRFVILGYERQLWQKKWEQKMLQDRFPWDVLINLDYQQGQSTSVAKMASSLVLDFSLRNCKGAGFFLGDQPLVQAATVAALVAAWRQNKENIVIPVYQGKRGNPVIFPAWSFEEMRHLKKDAGARSLFDAYPDKLCLVDVNDRGVITDLDTPEAYEAELERAKENKGESL